MIDIFSKCAWVIPLKVKNCIKVANAFQKSLNNLIANETKYTYIKAVNFTIG